MRWLIRILIALGALLALGVEVASARDLSFEERVKAEEAIERVYYSHQIGATKPFEEAVPRGLLERKVRTYLRESLALERIWQRPITSGMLLKETERIARSTRMPDRLLEIYAALGNDPFLIQECVARPALAGRLARSFYENGPGMREPATRKGEKGRGTGRALEQKALEEWLEGEVPGTSADSIPAVASPDALLALPASPAAEGTACGPDDFWDNHSLSDVPTPRGGHKAVWTGSLMVIWGGDNGVGVALNSGGRYDPATDSWEATSLIGAPSGRFFHTAVWTGSMMIVWGGSGVGAGSSGGRYDPLADTWAPTSLVNAPAARVGHTAVWAGSKMIIWGGRPNSGGYYNDGGLYDPEGDSWTPIVPDATTPSPRYGHSAVWTGSRMVIWGGNATVCSPNCTYLNSGGRFDPATLTWEATSLVGAPDPRIGHAAVWTGSRMSVWGGSPATVGYLNTGGRYDPIADTWQATSLVDAPEPRSAQAVWSGSEMIVWGGIASPTTVTTGGRYDPVSDTWRSTSTVGTPMQRSGYSLVWTGTEMIVWGGRHLAIFNSGGRYNPVSDTWVPTGTSGAPAGRTLHAAAWTGSLLLIWGGRLLNEDYSATLTPTGGRYDPALDLWTPTALLDAPSPRTGAAAFWTGDRMLVWGGSGDTGDLNTGGRYDPAADAWHPVTLTGAPESRSAPSLVWTGAEMMVWGGRVGDYPVNTGRRYDPATDSWTAISNIGAVERSGHLAVWADGVMIVWGGTDWGGNLNTGQIYDPLHEKWTSISTAGAPARSDNTKAVWSGSRMIVWGGGLVTTGGARYDPFTDSWSSVSAAGAPGPRTGFSLIWAGTRMILWGGQIIPNNSLASYNTGARYDPGSDSWETTSVTGAPDPRWDQSAVWTGSSVVFWGGDVGRDYLATGGEYLSSLQGTYYPDADSDGYGDPAAPLQACTPPPGYLVRDGDCNDADPAIHPRVAEICNGIDDNCDGRIDEGFDQDGDGYTTCTGDCNDFNAAVHPGAPEICNGVDDNCDGRIDEGFDQDGDGYKTCTGDCNDANPAIHPGAVEICNGIDDNCNGIIDDRDMDGDGYTGCGGPDCDDSNPAVHPGAVEICNGTDDNCNGLVDEVDLDGDGYSGCTTDCNDTDPAIHPGAVEVCDFVDNNCNGEIDEGFDQDGDGYTTCNLDCDDSDPGVWYAPVELWNLAVSEGSPSVVSWDDLAIYIGPETVNDLSSGNFSGAAGIDFSSATCLQSGGGPSVTDGRSDPAVGNGFWYLARARNSCGTGTYGNSQRDAGIPACP